MIPKIVHYCWFGENDFSSKAKKCISSWYRYLNNYEFVLWNEKTFDVNSSEYTRKAYKMGKYAFVTDYVRLYALYNFGGIYMDTDVEVLKPLDKFLQHRAFTGCESKEMCVTGIIGAERNHPWIKLLLDWYKNREFVSIRETNTLIITELTKREYGWMPGNMHQVLKDDLHIYPFEVFCAKSLLTGNISKTENTYTIHHFDGSWLSFDQKIKKSIILMGGKLLGEELLSEVIGKYIKLRDYL